MHTYEIKFKFEDGYQSVKYVPSFSVEEAEMEFMWIMENVYGIKPKILETRQLPKMGGKN